MGVGSLAPTLLICFGSTCVAQPLSNATSVTVPASAAVGGGEGVVGGQPTATVGSDTSAPASSTQMASAPVTAPISPEACVVRVFSSPQVSGVVTKSGLMKFALNSVLPSVMGSAMASGASPKNFDKTFKAAQNSANQTSIFMSNRTRDKASDVPEYIDGYFAAESLSGAVSRILAADVRFSQDPAPIYNGPPIESSKAALYFLGLTKQSCMRMLTIDSVVLEHSKDFKKRNELIIVSTAVEYEAGNDTAVKSARESVKIPLETSPIASSEPDLMSLKAELDAALSKSISIVLGKLQGKKK